MRISELIATLASDDLYELASRVLPGAHEIDRGLWPHQLEVVLTQTGHVEETIVGRRPPVASLLLRLVAAENHILALDEARPEIEKEMNEWAQRVSTGDLATRIRDRANIYRRMLEAAWRNDLRLDGSEIRMLGLLRDELGILRIEHYLLAHHESIQPYWRGRDELETVVETLAENGVLYRLEDGQVALPDELVMHAKSALGVEMSRESARRLYDELDSGTHLKAALADHDLPTSGSKQERVERLVDNFIPPHRVVDTLHIMDARDCARRHGLPVAGAKEELVRRIVGHFSTGADLREATEAAPAEVVAEPRMLSRPAFEELFMSLKGHQLQRILMAFDLRHAGSKEVRTAHLWESPYSESTLLKKLKNPELQDLLRGSGLDVRGSKGDRIERLIDHFRTAPGVPSQPGETGLLGEVVNLLSDVELSSKSPNRFDPVRDHLAEALALDRERIGVKYLGDPKNYRNRIGEALRSGPDVLLLLATAEEGDAVLGAARSRLAVSPTTNFLSLLVEASESWRSGGILCACETELLDRLASAFPDAEVDVAGVPPSVEAAQLDELATRARHELTAEWGREDVPAEQRVRRALLHALDRPDAIIRTKHISDGKNVGNRISEAIGAGCRALVLVVAEDLATIAGTEAQRQLSGAHEPSLAVVLAEADGGGYAPPSLVFPE